MNNGILTNIVSLYIRNDLKSASSQLSCLLQRMTSGLRNNYAKDDSAGCVISSKINTRLNGTYQAQRNLQRGVSMLNVAQGAYENMNDILLRLRGLSLRAMDETNDEKTRQALEDEANELTSQLEQIRVGTEYNGISLFNNSNVIEQNSTTTQVTPEATTFSSKTTLIAQNLSIENDSGGGIFENDSGDNNENKNTLNQGVEDTNLTLSSLDETQTPMMMSARSVEAIPETIITFAKNETKIINIGNNSYEVKQGGNSNYLEFSYKQDTSGKITFDGTNFIITSINNESSNLILKGYSTILFLNTTNDIVDIQNASNYVVSEGGNNEIKISGQQSRVILNGNGSDTVYSSSSLANNYIYLGEGDDDIANLKVNNSIVTKKAGNVNYNLSNLKNCTLVNIDKFDSDFQFIDVGTGSSMIAIGDRQYKIEDLNGNLKSQHLFYKYDNEKQRTVFIGYNSKISAQTNSGEKSLVYGVDNRFNGTSENDDILVGVGSFNCTIYAQDGNDLLVTEEFTTSYSNYLHGGNGDDTLIGNSKTGYWGDAGDDTIIVNAIASSSGATGGAGNDTFEINGKTEIYDTSGDNIFKINTDNLTINAGGSSGTFVVNGNNNTITGTNGDDTFEINGSNNNIDGGGGDDYYVNNSLSSNIQNALDATTNGKLVFNSQNEEQSFSINGKTYTIKNNSNSINTLYYAYDNGEILLTGSNFDIIASDGVDHKIAINGNNNIIEGGNKNDVITIKNGENNYVFGNRGNDTINLDYKNNSADGGIGDDKININATTNLSINGNIGDDIINFNANNISNVQAGDGDDKITGNTTSSVINLGNGNNSIELSGDDNKIIGGNEKNIISIVGNSNDIQAGGEIELDIEGDWNYFIATSGVIEGKIEGNNNNLNFKNADSSTTKIRGSQNVFSGSSGIDEVVITGNRNVVNGNKGNDDFKINEGNSNKVDGGTGRNILYNLGTSTEAENIINITPQPLDIDLHIGSSAGGEQVISTRLLFTIGDFELNFDTSEKAAENIEKIDKLLNQINKQKSSIGSTLNRLDSVYELQNKEIENLSIRKSLIMDTDIANEAQKLIKVQILQQISISLMSQVNSLNRNLALNLLAS